MNIKGALKEEQRIRECMEREKESLERRIDELEGRNGNNNNNAVGTAAAVAQDKIKVNSTEPGPLIPLTFK